jgi:hypothetical protein
MILEVKVKRQIREMVMPTEKEPMTHVFLKPCGCLSAAVVNVPVMFSELARQQRYASKHGQTYKLMETEDVRKMKWKCDLHRTIRE